MVSPLCKTGPLAAIRFWQTVSDLSVSGSFCAMGVPGEPAQAKTAGAPKVGLEKPDAAKCASKSRDSAF
jgi:hypothetical protein